MDRVVYLHASLLEQVRELADRVLCLRDGEPVPGDDDHALRICKQRREVFDRTRPHAPTLLPRHRTGRRLHLAEGAEEDVSERATHRVAHQLGQKAAGGADQRSRNDEGEVVEREPTRGHGEPGECVEQRDHDRHVRAADRQDEGDAKDERKHHQGQEREGDRSDREHRDHEADDRRGEEAVDQLLTRICDRRPGHQLLQLRECDQAARKGDRADDDAEDAGQPLRQRRVRTELDQLSHRHERCGPATRAVEQGHHLRDLGHLHLARTDRPDRRADHDPDQDDDRARASEVELRHGRDQRDDHAGRGGEVARVTAGNLGERFGDQVVQMLGAAEHRSARIR